MMHPWGFLIFFLAIHQPRQSRTWPISRNPRKNITIIPCACEIGSTEVILMAEQILADMPAFPSTKDSGVFPKSLLQYFTAWLWGQFPSCQQPLLQIKPTKQLHFLEQPQDKWIVLLLAAPSTLAGKYWDVLIRTSKKIFAFMLLNFNLWVSYIHAPNSLFKFSAYCVMTVWRSVYIGRA